LSVIDTLITDRTQADYDRAVSLAEKGLSGMTADELAEYRTGMKGAYNAADLNRVGQALKYLQEELNGYGYAVTVNVKTNWTASNIPTEAEMTTYLNNVAAIRRVLEVLATTPEVPGTMQKLTWQRANDIEKILADVQAVINQVVAGFRRSGAFTMWSAGSTCPPARVI